MLNQVRTHMARMLTLLTNATGLTLEQYFTLCIALIHSITATGPLAAAVTRAGSFQQSRPVCRHYAPPYLGSGAE